MFSKRTEWPLQPNRFTVLLEEMRKSGMPILDLTESNPTRCGFRYLSQEILTPLTNPRNLQYDPSPKGMIQAREAVAGYYAGKGISVSPEQIFLTASTSESYTFLFRLLCDPQDHFLASRPSYPLFDYLAALNDVALNPYLLKYRGKWEMEEESFIKAISPKARGVIIVNPNNPTGTFLKQRDLNFLNRIGREKKLSLISDEVFLDYAFADSRGWVKSCADNQDILTFALSGISKILGLPQMKLAWIVVSGPKDLRQGAIQRLEVIADTYLSVNTPVQNALASWLQEIPSIQKEILERVSRNRRFLLEQCEKTDRAKCLHSEGGWHAVLRVEGIDEEKFILRLLEKERVMVHPGYFFDFDPEESHLVLSLLPSPDIFKQGVGRLFTSFWAGSEKMSRSQEL